MNHPILARLCFDQYSNVEDLDKQAIVVVDVQSYAAARRTIEGMKAGESEMPVSIVVRSRHFVAGFHDLELLGNLVQITRVAPRSKIAAAFHVEVPPDLSDRDLLTLGISEPADLSSSAGKKGIRDRASFEDALLEKALGSRVFRTSDIPDFEAWFRDLADFFYSEDVATKPGWAVEYIKYLVKERTRAILDRFGRLNLWPFVSALLQGSSSPAPRALLSQLAVRYWLRGYSRLARKAVVDNLTDQVGQWQDVKGEDFVLAALAPWCEALYKKANEPLIEQLEHVLALLLEEDDLIEDRDLGRYIQRMSGRFMAEYQTAQTRLGQLVLDRYGVSTAGEQRLELMTLSTQLDSHFAPLLQKMRPLASTAGWLAPVIEFSDVISHLSVTEPVHWADWLATYEMLIKAKQLHRQLPDIVPVQYSEHLADLSAAFSTLNEKLNSQFADWLLREYPGLVSSRTDRPLLVMNAARFALDHVSKGAKVILLVLDGLDWELWRYLRSALGERQFVVQGEEAGLAILPTVTEFSRRALFGGLSPRNMTSFVDDIYGTDIPAHEEARTLARALGYLGRIEQLKPISANRRIRYLKGELVYVNGSEQDFRQALALDAKCYAFVYTEIDSHIHDSKLAESELKRTVQHWLEHLVEEIIRGIRENTALRDDMSLRMIVASDHGFLDISEQSQVRFEKGMTSFLDLERHGRLAIARIKVEEGVTDIAATTEMVRGFYDRQSAAWHVIWREQSEQYGLADSSSSEGEVVAWLMPRLLQYVSKGKGNYVHGGLSMYEAVVPVAVLTRGILEVQAPVVTLTSKLESEEEGILSIAVLNKNDQPLRHVVIHVPELGLARVQTRDIGPGSIERLDVAVTPSKSGDVAVRVICEGDIGGVRKRFEEMRVLTVQPGRLERMRLSTRRTFDEDW